MLLVLIFVCGFITIGFADPGDPNILLIIVDQERQQELIESERPFPYNRTSIDTLKSQGHSIEFTNAYSTYPACSPSRATIFTGRYPQEVGIYTNCDLVAGNPPLPTPAQGTPNLASELSEAGYTTAYYGKWHLNTLNTPANYGFGSAKYADEGNGREPVIFQGIKNSTVWTSGTHNRWASGKITVGRSR